MVERVSMNDLIGGSSVAWIHTIICYECMIGYFDDDIVHELWTDYPRLTTFIMSYEGSGSCTTVTTLITIVGCTISGEH